MANLTPDIAADVLAACQAGAEAAAEALSGLLGQPCSLNVGNPQSLGAKDLVTVSEFSGPGLAIVFGCGEGSALLVLPSATELLADWCCEPDESQQKQLDELAATLAAALLPESIQPDNVKTCFVPHLAQGLGRAGMAETASVIPLSITAGDAEQTLQLIWPVANPDQLDQDSGESVPGSMPSGANSNRPAATAPASFDSLPDYTRSLLKISVPVVVNLASKKQALRQILQLGPGSIIQFEKSCDEMLDLCAGEHPIAIGEAVKVGDKFGLRINSMILPAERFHTARPQPNDG